MSKSGWKYQRERRPARLGLRCGMTGKVRFGSHDGAMVRAGEIMEEGSTARMLRAYACDFCGGWHLTHKTPRAATI